MTDGGRSAVGRHDDGRAAGARAVDCRSYYQLDAEAGQVDRGRLVPHRRRGHDRADGYVKITDRTKDLIKSGGEWISSLDLENALDRSSGSAGGRGDRDPASEMGRASACGVVLKPGKTASRSELRDYLAPRFAKFWLPEAFVFVSEIPRTSTGKVMKSKLREQFQGWRW